MKDFVRKLINSALDNAKNVGDLELSVMPEIVVEKPKEEKFGDFSTTLAMGLAKSERRKPYEIAEILSRHLQRSDDNIASVAIAGPGFLNITMRPTFFLERLLTVAEQSDRYGSSNAGQGKKVLLEFVSANPTGPLHVGHGRGAAVGDMLGRLLDKAGYNVSTEYYINDVGNQMNTLGRSTWARYLELQGRENDFPSDYYQGEYIKDIASNITFNPLPYGDMANSAYEGIQNIYGNWLDDKYDAVADWYKPVTTRWNNDPFNFSPHPAEARDPYYAQEDWKPDIPELGNYGLSLYPEQVMEAGPLSRYYNPEYSEWTQAEKDLGQKEHMQRIDTARYNQQEGFGTLYPGKAADRYYDNKHNAFRDRQREGMASGAYEAHSNQLGRGLLSGDMIGEDMNRYGRIHPKLKSDWDAEMAGTRADPFNISPTNWRDVLEYRSDTRSDWQKWKDSVSGGRR